MLGNFGDVVRAAGGVLPPVSKVPVHAPVEKTTVLTYSRLSKRLSGQLMSHDEALKRLLSTKQLQEILNIVEKNQTENTNYNSLRATLKQERRGKGFLQKLSKTLSCCGSPQTKSTVEPVEKIALKAADDKRKGNSAANAS
mgnify:CR=1 FL=1